MVCCEFKYKMCTKCQGSAYEHFKKPMTLFRLRQAFTCFSEKMFKTTKWKYQIDQTRIKVGP